MKKLFLILALAIISVSAQAITIDELISAIHKVETSGRVGAILGDNGKALGPLQIHRVCWADAMEFNQSIGGKYENCADLKYSKKIFVSYSARYNKGMNFSNLTLGDCEAVARLWNSGPQWKRKMEKTDKYWSKVKSFLVK